MTKLKVLIPTHPSRDQLPTKLKEFHDFQQQFDVHIEEFLKAEDLKNALKTRYNDISGLWITVPVVKALGGLDQFTEHFPESLKIIGYPSVGANLFDGEALRIKGINLANIGDASAKNVADVALILALHSFRYSSFFERTFRESEGDINKTKSTIGSLEFDDKGRTLPHTNSDNVTERVVVAGNQVQSPAGKSVGMVGLGSIGKEIAKRLDAIGMEIKYTKRTPLTEEELLKLSYKPKFYPSFEELIPHVDLILLAVPHTPQTINLINEDSLKLVKKGVRIVNIGRGSAIDENALFKALDDGTVNSVGLDVFQNEPHIDKRFLNRPDVSILPHLGAFTVDNFQDCAIRTLENITNALTGNLEEVSIVN